MTATFPDLRAGPRDVAHGVVLVEDHHHDALSEGGWLLPRLDLDQHADIQVEAIRRAARERGWHLVAEHVDGKSSPEPPRQRIAGGLGFQRSSRAGQVWGCPRTWSAQS